MTPNIIETIKLYAVECIEIDTWWSYQSVNSSFTRLFYSKNADGNTWIRHSGQKWRMDSQTLLIAPPFTKVDYVCESPCQLYGLIFTAEVFSGIQFFSLDGVNFSTQSDDLLMGSLKRLLEINPGIEVPEANPFIKGYNESIRNLSNENGTLPFQAESNAILRLLTSRFLTEQTSLFSSQASPSKERILKILDYIDKNMDQQLSLESLAKHVSLNPTYLSNHFADYLKIRPTTYIKKRRIERAQHLLITTNYPLKQIAYDVGIPNTDYFFQVFKKELGCTPSEYRNKHATG